MYKVAVREENVHNCLVHMIKTVRLKFQILVSRWIFRNHFIQGDDSLQRQL